jgi:hypothetical protein
MEPMGQTMWVVPGGWIPAQSTGSEPEYTSRDELWLLNTGDEPAEIEITIYYQEHQPVGPFPLAVGPERVRCVRVNDLIDPEAVRLETAYAAVIRSSMPIVVQIARYDTRQPAQTMSWSLAFAVDSEQPTPH